MVDVLGLTIFLIGVGLIVLELSMPGYFIGVLGTAAIVVGMVQMMWPPFLFSWWSPFVVVVVVPLAMVASVQFYKRIAPPDTRPETYSSDRMVGETGRVIVAVEPDTTRGKVKIGGIVWSAESDAPIPVGATVVVRRVEGVHMVVDPLEEPMPAAAMPPTEDLPVESSEESERHG